MFPQSPSRPATVRAMFSRRFCALAAAALAAVVLAPPAHAQSLEWKSGASGRTQPQRDEQSAPVVRRAAFVEPATPSRAVDSQAPAGEVQAAAFIQPAQSRAKRPSAVQRVQATQRIQSTQRPAVPGQAAMPVQRAIAQVADTDFASAVKRAIGAKTDAPDAQQAGAFISCGTPGCGCALGMPCPGPSCGVEPGCCLPEPGCGCVEPGCGCEGGVYYDDPACAAPMVQGPVCGDPVCGDCVCGEVGCAGACVAPGCPPCLGGCYERGAVPICIWLPPIKEIVLFGGVQGFKSPLDYNPRGRDPGNFGFHEGINIGGRMSWLPVPDMGFQIGYRATQNQLSGDVPTGDDSHSQSFFTAGLFRRSFVGWQYGFVYDLLQDERQGSTDFSQVRGLISFTNHAGGEVGYEFAAGTSEQTLTGVATHTFEPADQHKLFWRYHGKTGGEFRSLIGLSGDGHVILGGDLHAPLNHEWSIQTGFTYFVPTDSGNTQVGGVPVAASAKATEEAWNIGISLVWHWGGQGERWYRSPWRPMFDVADNGSMVIDDID